MTVSGVTSYEMQETLKPQTPWDRGQLKQRRKLYTCVYVQKMWKFT